MAKVLVVLLADFKLLIVLALQQFLHVVLHKEPVLVVARALEQVDVDPHQLFEMPIPFVATEAVLQFPEN